jgi:hypothetical protein
MRPQLDHAPADGFQQPPFLTVTDAVAPELGDPKLAIALRQREAARRTAVPEAAMNVDRDLWSQEHKVWTPGDGRNARTKRTHPLTSKRAP